MPEQPIIPEQPLQPQSNPQSNPMEQLMQDITSSMGLEQEGVATGTLNEDAEPLRKEEIQEEKSAQYEFTPDQKKEVVDYVIKLVDDCEASRTDWKTIRRECEKLYEGIREPKSDPWQNCSNISVMAVPMHCNLMHSKLLPSVWNENLTYWQPVSADDIANVENVRKFMDWVVRRELKLAEPVDDIIHDFIISGTVALKVRKDIEYRYVRDKGQVGKYKEIGHMKVVVDNLPIEEVYLPYLWKGEDDSEFIAHNSYMRLPEITALKERGAFVCSDTDIENIKAKITEETEDNVNSERAKAEGTREFNINLQSHPVRLIECYAKWFVDGRLLESAFIVEYKSRTYMSGKPLTAINPIGRRPFVIGQFIRRTNRPYGIGLPEVMRGLAKELDAIHNQRIDAGSIAIAPFFFYRAASSIKPDKVQIGPGVGVPVDDIKDVLFAQFPSNFMTSFQEERIIIEYIEKLTTTSAYQMGRESDIVKSRATASGTLALISQGEQAYTILGLRAQRIISKMLTKILQTYQCFMPVGFADRILGDDAGKLLFPEGLDPEEIDGGYDCYMLLDSTAGNKAMERQVNTALVQMAPNLLLLAQSPRGYEIAREWLISIGKIDIEKYLGPKPQQEPGIPGGLPVGPSAGGGLAPAE